MVDFRFTTTALRLAEVFTSNDIGKVAADLALSNYYWVTSTGSGVDTMSAFPDKFGYIDFKLNDFREMSATGDVGAIAANGGILASDTGPLLRGDAAGNQEIIWVASNSDVVGTQVSVPRDFDGTQDVIIDLWVASGGTTDVCTITVETAWDGGALVSDTATGTATTADQLTTATVAAADVADTPRTLTVLLTPAAHTTDTMNLYACTLRYYRK